MVFSCSPQRGLPIASPRFNSLQCANGGLWHTFFFNLPSCCGCWLSRGTRIFSRISSSHSAWTRYSFSARASDFCASQPFRWRWSRIFLFSNMGQLFGLAMGVLYSGLAFLFGGYAYQVQKAEASQDRNRRTFDELQAAHRQLQGYADQATSLAVEQERNRLARELHDSVTQTVFSMNLAAQSTRLLLDRDPSQRRANCSASRSWPRTPRPRSVPSSRSCARALPPRKGCRLPCGGWPRSGRSRRACRSRWKWTARGPCLKWRRPGCTPSRRKR